MSRKHRKLKLLPRRGPPTNLRPGGSHKDRREQEARKLLEDLRRQLVEAFGHDTTE